MLPSNDPDSVLVNAFCCFDPSQEPNHIQRFAETLCERFWHAFKSNKFQPNLKVRLSGMSKGNRFETLRAVGENLTSTVWVTPPRGRNFHKAGS